MPSPYPVRTPVTLRAVREDDKSYLFALRRDIDLQGLVLTVPAAIDDVSLHAWVERRCQEADGAFRMVEDAETGKAVGYVQIVQTHWRNGFGYGGIVLGAEARGKGIGRSALDALTDHARDVLGLRKLMAEIRVDNAPSIGLHLSVGYRRVGVLENHFVAADGQVHDVFLFERSLPEVKG